MSATDRTCPGCDGDGLCKYDDALPGEPCDWCRGTGVREPRHETDAELRERVRFMTRLIEEPMAYEAIRFLLARKLDSNGATRPESLRELDRAESRLDAGATGGGLVAPVPPCLPIKEPLNKGWDVAGQKASCK